MRRSTGSATGRRAKRTFSAEFKREAVELMRRRRTEGVSLSQVARELDIGAGLLWEWARKLEGGGDAAPARSPGETLEEENRRLRRENAILREEREFAKKALVSSTGQCNIVHVAPIRENIDDGTHWTAWTFRCPEA